MQPIQVKLHGMPTDTASNSRCCVHHMMECGIQQLLPELRLCSLLLARLPAAAASASRAHSALTCDTLFLALAVLVHNAVAAGTMVPSFQYQHLSPRQTRVHGQPLRLRLTCAVDGLSAKLLSVMSMLSKCDIRPSEQKVRLLSQILTAAEAEQWHTVAQRPAHRQHARRGPVQPEG